ncbi:MAG: ATP-binding protein, partial [Bacteroidota bacterium]|nr:ATP-binding protein [Bacteroidota bacterium]
VTTTADVIQCCFKNNRIASYQILFHNSSNQFINCFYFAQNNHCLWVGSNSGILYCKHSSGKIDTLAVPDNYQVRSIMCDAQNNTWVGTDKGLFVYANSKLIQTFTTDNGLLNDCIYSMLTDDTKKTIYASSNLGLSVLQLNGVLKNYTKEKGLQENEFNTSAVARTSKGKLFFGGVNGITAFYPSDVITEPDHPSLLIYQTEINDQPFDLDSATWNAHTYKLSYHQNKIDFSLTAFGLQAASGYIYEYKMKGFDKYWTTTNNPTNISYHLPPGNYEFKARVMQFPSAFISRNIIIAAPFWQRWWFYLVCIVFVFAALSLTARAIYRRRYFGRLQTLRIRQQVLAERERISRDLHDNIGAYASAISANVDDVIYQFNASDHVALKRLKNSAREIIIQLRDSIWALNKENQTVIMLSDRIKSYVQKLQPTYPNIDFDVDENIEQNQTIASITALHLLRIVQEAVHNAVKHSGCSSIQIGINSQSPIVISIKDNGCGMPDQPLMGEGLKNMQLRAAEIGWHLILANHDDGCCIQLCNTK